MSLGAAPITGLAAGMGGLLRNTRGRSAYLEQMSLEKKREEAIRNNKPEEALKLARRMDTLKKRASMSTRWAVMVSHAMNVSAFSLRHGRMWTSESPEAFGPTLAHSS